jgi:hypothetical protein
MKDEDGCQDKGPLGTYRCFPQRQHTICCLSLGSFVSVPFLGIRYLRPKNSEPTAASGTVGEWQVAARRMGRPGAASRKDNGGISR